MSRSPVLQNTNHLARYQSLAHSLVEILGATSLPFRPFDRLGRRSQCCYCIVVVVLVVVVVLLVVVLVVVAMLGSMTAFTISRIDDTYLHGTVMQLCEGIGALSYGVGGDGISAWAFCSTTEDSLPLVRSPYGAPHVPMSPALRHSCWSVSSLPRGVGVVPCFVDVFFRRFLLKFQFPLGAGSFRSFSIIYPISATSPASVVYYGQIGPKSKVAWSISSPYSIRVGAK